MTKTELQEIIKNGENSGVEFKSDTIPNHQLAKEIVAFSNLSGGIILLGVDDNGEVSGITKDNLEEWIVTICRDKIRPAITPFYEVIRDYEPSKNIAVVRITRGYDVHSLWHNNNHKYYLRVGSQSREADQGELRRLFQQRGAVRAEKLPVSGTRITDLDRRRLRDYFCRIREQEVPDDNDEKDWSNLLINTEIMTEEAVSVGGLLLFGNLPNKFLPYAGISAWAFYGTEKDYATRESTTLRGPMIPLFNSNGEIVENGLVEQFVEFVNRNVRKTSKIVGGRRIDKTVYPDEVIREGIINALIHRDYLLTGTDIESGIYSDRLEIVSPGKLPNGITPEKMRVGTRSCRNELIKAVMQDYAYLEHMGMGIPRKIISGMRNHNGTVPALIEDGERFKLCLHANVPNQAYKTK